MNQLKHYVGNFAQKAIIKQGNTMLVCKGVGDTRWELPGGRLHENESPRDGLIREIQEELGITIEVGNPVHICRSYHVRDKTWQLIAGFECSIIGNSKMVHGREEIEEWKWISKEQLNEIPMFDDCREILDVWLKNLS